MKIVFSDRAWADYLWWRDQVDGPTRINRLIEECRRSPFSGLGKPEPLRKDFAGFLSRRTTGEHRLVYRVQGKSEAQQLALLQCRVHYE